MTCPAGAACRYFYDQFRYYSRAHGSDNTHVTYRTSISRLIVYFWTRDILTLTGCLASPYCQVECTKTCICSDSDGTDGIVIRSPTMAPTISKASSKVTAVISNTSSESLESSLTFAPIPVGIAPYDFNTVTLSPTATALTLRPKNKPKGRRLVPFYGRGQCSGGIMSSLAFSWLSGMSFNLDGRKRSCRVRQWQRKQEAQ